MHRQIKKRTCIVHIQSTVSERLPGALGHHNAHNLHSTAQPVSINSDVSPVRYISQTSHAKKRI